MFLGGIAHAGADYNESSWLDIELDGNFGPSDCGDNSE